MRLAAQVKGGFYPAHEVGCGSCRFLLAATGGSKVRNPRSLCRRRDGHSAIERLLRCPPTSVHAIELDDSRADAIRAALPEAHVLAPADFFGCRASFGSFSFIWLNPPFDYSYGGIPGGRSISHGEPRNG